LRTKTAFFFGVTASPQMTPFGVYLQGLFGGFMELQAQKRQAGSKVQGHIPGIIYNKETSIPVNVEMRAFDKVFRSQGTSSIIDLNLDGENHEVLVKAVQMDKRRRVPQHVDFYKVMAGQTVEVHVHLNLVGTAEGVRDGGVMDIQKREVFIEVLPRLIPHQVDVDVSQLKIGQSLHIRDLVKNLPAEAKVLDDLDLTVLAVVPPRAEEVAPAAGTTAEPEVITKGKKEEEAAA
jgi:large subunit ribosomal protein L25